MRIPPKLDTAMQRKALERENALLRKLASRLEHTIDAMRRTAANDRARSDFRNGESIYARKERR
jgi:hypothetical protein